VTHITALPGNPYDGHTLATVTPAMEDMIGNTIERLVADAGYRGYNAPTDYKFRIYTSGQKRRLGGSCHGSAGFVDHACWLDLGRLGRSATPCFRIQGSVEATIGSGVYAPRQVGSLAGSRSPTTSRCAASRSVQSTYPKRPHAQDRALL
jgi:hypothetical protein